MSFRHPLKKKSRVETDNKEHPLCLDGPDKNLNYLEKEAL